MDSIEQYERGPAETLGIAEAIAMRHIKIQLQLERMGEELGIDPTLTGYGDLTQNYRAEVEFYISQLDDPTQIMNPQRMTNLSIARGNKSGLADFYAEEGYTPQPDGIHNLISEFSKNNGENTGLSPRQQTDEFLTKLNAITTLAQERQVSISSVYADDELYCEAYRRSHTFDSEALQAIAILKSLSPENITEMLVRNFEDLMPAEFITDTTREERTETVLEFQLDDEWQDEIQETVFLVHELLRQYFMLEVVNIWGKHTFDRLTDEQKEILMPKLPLTTPILEALESH